MSALLELRRLANEPQHKTVLTFLSTRKDNRPLTIDKVMAGTRHKIPRLEVVHLFKSLDRLNLCNFVAGRRNFPSRVMFYYTPESIGKVALGQEIKLQNIPQATVAEAAGKAIRDAIQAPTPGTSDPNLPFEVQTSDVATLFILPTTATDEDKKRLMDYIQQMPLKRSA